jgi:hypothetical protein
MPVTINGTSGIVGPDGSASTPAIQGSDTNTGIFFPAADTIAFAEGGTEVMRIDSSGNVRIGTTTDLGGADRLTVVGGNFAVRRTSGITMLVGDSTQAGYVGTITSHACTFLANSTERMRINPLGDVCIGTTTQIQAGLFNLAFDTGFYCGIATRPTNNAGYDAARFFNSSTTQIGSISCTTTNTSYVTSSDYRLKEDVQPMVGALAKVAALKPCTYKWKSTGEVSQGFIAHELAEVCPDAVSGEKDAVDEDGNIKPQGIDTSFLVATLTAAIQEQQALITSLTARIAALEGAAQ